jgi:hypothetical protein
MSRSAVMLIVAALIVPVTVRAQAPTAADSNGIRAGPAGGAAGSR